MVVRGKAWLGLLHGNIGGKLWATATTLGPHNLGTALSHISRRGEEPWASAQQLRREALRRSSIGAMLAVPVKG